MLVTVKDISLRLAARAEQVSALLFPKGRRNGTEWTVGSIAGNPGDSLKIHLAGEKAGVWSDFATGQAGDLIDLWAQVKGITLADALRDVKAYLGIQSPGFEPREKTYRRPPKPQCSKLEGDDPVLKYLKDVRKLNDDAIQAYKIRSQSTKIVFPYLREGELILVKYLALERQNGKKIITVESGCEPCLFGWQAIPDKKRELTISEGEIDAMSLWQYGFPAVSVPFGAGKDGKHNWIENEFENLERFETIYLCFDQDKEGEIAAKDISNRLGRHRCKIVTLPKKDANECLQAGISQSEIAQCFQNAKTVDPDGLRGAETYFEEVVGEFFPKDGVLAGVASPWQKSKNNIRFRPAELSIWTGIGGHGKTTLLNQIILEAITQKEKACIASLEIKPRKLLYRMTRQTCGVSSPNVETIQKAHDWFRGRLWVFDYVGSAKGAWILEVFKYARYRYGITQFVIDSLMKCGISEDDYNAQKLFVETLADFKNEHGVHVHLVAHARKGEDEDRAPGKLDVKGTGTITDLADNVFSVWRNKKKELARVQPFNSKTQEILNSPDAFMSCDKQRNGEWEGRVALWWHGPSFQYVEAEDTPPKNYLGLGYEQPLSFEGPQEVSEDDL